MTVQRRLRAALPALLLTVFAPAARGDVLPPPPTQPLVEKWVAYFDPLPDKTYQARAVAVDSAGNIAVTGISTWYPEEMSSQIRYYTAKFSGLDGTLLWSAHCRGNQTFTSSNPALAVD